MKEPRYVVLWAEYTAGGNYYEAIPAYDIEEAFRMAGELHGLVIPVFELEKVINKLKLAAEGVRA